MFFHFVLLLCTLWELSARFFFNRYFAFTDQKKKKIIRINNIDIMTLLGFLNLNFR